MKNISDRLAALSPEQLELLKERLKNANIDIDVDAGARGTAGDGTAENPITPAEEREYYPLSSVQRRLFMLSRFEGTGIVYNVFTVKIAEGDLDEKKVETAFKSIVKRHEAFRTSFEYVAGEPVQRIRKPEDVDFKIEFHDARDKEDAKNRVERFIRPFDLSRAPLLRVGIVTLSETESILMYDSHHIIIDGGSKGILAQEFIAFYNGRDLPAITIQYKDFSQWLNSAGTQAALERQETYWLKTFGGEIPVLDLPVDHPRPAEKVYDGDNVRFEIEKNQVRALRKLAAEKNTTLFTVLLSLYYVFLSRISRQNDIVVGIPIAGRRHVAGENIIGMFVNTLALRNRPEGEIPFENFLEQVKRQTLDAFENQDYQFEDLVNKVIKHRDVSRNPIFDVFFSFTYPGVSAELEEEWGKEVMAGLKIGPYRDDISLSMFDLYLAGTEAKGETDELFLCFIYAAALFKKETVARFTGYFKEIVSSVTGDKRVRLKDIKMSHDLGIAKSTVFADQEEMDFDF